MSHTPEPWFDNGDCVQGGLPDLPEVVRFYSNKANRDRIVACVNALAGVEDPAAKIRQLRSDLAVLAAEVEAGRALSRARMSCVFDLTDDARNELDGASAALSVRMEATDASGALARAGGAV